MKTIFLTILLLGGMIWIGCKKDESKCWDCEWRYPTKDSISNHVFCDSTEAFIQSLDTMVFTDQNGNEVEFLGCTQQ